MIENKINKVLILREQLALQRTTLANNRTFLSFLRTALYFFIAGLSLESVLEIEYSFIIEWFFFISSMVIFSTGLLNYFKHKRMIIENEKNIGNYKTEFYE